MESTQLAKRQVSTESVLHPLGDAMGYHVEGGVLFSLLSFFFLFFFPPLRPARDCVGRAGC